MHVPVADGMIMTTDRSRLDPALVRAYLETDYRVFANPPFVLRIGWRQPSLIPLLARHSADGCAFLTACNPRGRLLTAGENTRRQARLGSELDSLGLHGLDGIGIHPEGGWPGESSRLILGASLARVIELAGRHEQNAFVWCAVDGVPRLHLLR